MKSISKLQLEIGDQHPGEGMVLSFRRWMLFALWGLAGAVIGFTAWGGQTAPISLLLLVALPVGWTFTSSRQQAGWFMWGYFLAGARGLPSGATVFFGSESPAWWGWVLWFSATLLLATPFLLAWSSRSHLKPFGFLVAVVSLIAPPLCIVGWINPISVAGVLFPGAAWLGLFATTFLFYGLAARKRAYVFFLAAVAMALNIHAYQKPDAMQPPARWMGFDTHFSRLSSGGADQAGNVLASLARIEWLSGVAANMPAGATLILPETLIGRYDGVAQRMLSSADVALREKNSRVLVGAEVPRGEGYWNVVLVLGASTDDDRMVRQGIPVPISMWKPWADDGAEGDLFTTDQVIRVDRKSVGVAICYEQLLAYSVLKLMLQEPSILVAVGNVWWARETSIPTIQRQSIGAFSMLFGIPLITAFND